VISRVPLPAAFLTRPLAHRALHDRAAGRPENSRAAVRAAVAAGYAIIVAPFVLRTVNFTEIRRIFVATAMQSGVILMLVGAAVTFAWLVTVSGMARGIADAMLQLSDNPTILLFLVNVLLLLIGMFLDAGPAILILGPVLAPIFVEMGVHPVHFALVMCVNLTLGLATPPMGLVLFVTASVAGVKVESIVRAMLPFLAVEIAVLLLITFFPPLTLALPRWLGRPRNRWRCCANASRPRAGRPTRHSRPWNRPRSSPRL
jgi:tripartite ATP-independent transporter DctM subunit